MEAPVSPSSSTPDPARPDPASRTQIAASPSPPQPLRRLPRPPTPLHLRRRPRRCHCAASSAAVMCRSRRPFSSRGYRRLGGLAWSARGAAAVFPRLRTPPAAILNYAVAVDPSQPTSPVLLLQASTFARRPQSSTTHRRGLSSTDQSPTQPNSVNRCCFASNLRQLKPILSVRYSLSSFNRFLFHLVVVFHYYISTSQERWCFT